MRKRWRYGAPVVAIIAGLALSAVSCSRDATAPASSVTTSASARPRVVGPQVKELREANGWMGQYHTDALAYVYTRISDGKTRSLSKAGRCRVGTAALKDFHKSFRRNGQALVFSDLSTVDGLCDEAARGDLRVGQSVAVERVGDVQRDDLSAAASGYMTQIESAFDADVSLGVIESTIYSIENAAAATLPADEAGAVVGLASIAISSADYWDANLDKWGNPLDLPEPYNRLANGNGGVSASVVTTPAGGPRFGVSAKGRSIMKADVSAALSTFLYEWWLGMIALEKAALRGAAASLIAGILTM